MKFEKAFNYVHLDSLLCHMLLHRPHPYNNACICSRHDMDISYYSFYKRCVFILVCVSSNAMI